MKGNGSGSGSSKGKSGSKSSSGASKGKSGISGTGSTGTKTTVPSSAGYRGIQTAGPRPSTNTSNFNKPSFSTATGAGFAASGIGPTRPSNTTNFTKNVAPGAGLGSSGPYQRAGYGSYQQPPGYTQPRQNISGGQGVPGYNSSLGSSAGMGLGRPTSAPADPRRASVGGGYGGGSPSRPQPSAQTIANAIAGPSRPSVSPTASPSPSSFYDGSAFRQPPNTGNSLVDGLQNKANNFADNAWSKLATAGFYGGQLASGLGLGGLGGMGGNGINHAGENGGRDVFGQSDKLGRMPGAYRRSPVFKPQLQTPGIAPSPSPTIGLAPPTTTQPRPGYQYPTYYSAWAGLPRGPYGG